MVLFQSTGCWLTNSLREIYPFFLKQTASDLFSLISSPEVVSTFVALMNVSKHHMPNVYLDCLCLAADVRNRASCKRHVRNPKGYDWHLWSLLVGRGWFSKRLCQRKQKTDWWLMQFHHGLYYAAEKRNVIVCKKLEHRCLREMVGSSNSWSCVEHSLILICIWSNLYKTAS